jgi:nicotinamide-nucleotide amidase
MSARAVFEILTTKGWKLSSAESCTGGMVAAAITDIAGSSNIFDRGFVTYSNAAKIDMLRVNASVIERHGAVSAETAVAMAEGAIRHSRADISISITGIAGPSGGSPGKPVGLVYFAVAIRNGEVFCEHKIFQGPDRSAIREAAREFAFVFLLQIIQAA